MPLSLPSDLASEPAWTEACASLLPDERRALRVGLAETELAFALLLNADADRDALAVVEYRLRPFVRSGETLAAALHRVVDYYESGGLPLDGDSTGEEIV